MVRKLEGVKNASECRLLIDPFYHRFESRYRRLVVADYLLGSKRMTSFVQNGVAWKISEQNMGV